MNEIKLKCMKCGSDIERESRYCSTCGSNMEFQNKISGKRIKVSWRWVFFSLIAILVFEYIFATIAGQLFLFFSGAEFIELETGIVVSSLGSITGIFFGSLYSSYLSPGITIKEPVIGAALEIVISQLILIVMAGSFTSLIIIRIAIIMSIAFGGAKTGEFFQKKFR
jgi:predicted nucleic acid-binding Zn ribbon protein